MKVAMQIIIGTAVAFLCGFVGHSVWWVTAIVAFMTPFFVERTWDAFFGR